MRIADYEELILCALLRNPDLIRVVGAELTPDKFSETSRRLIYSTTLDMSIGNVPVDIPSIIAYLGDKARVVGGEGYLIQLRGAFGEHGVDSDSGLPNWVKAVDGAGRLRHMGLVINEYHKLYEDFERLLNSVGDFDSFLSDFMGKVQRTADGVKTDFKTSKEAVLQAKIRIEAELSGKSTSVVNCGMPSLYNNFLFETDALTVLSALSSMGKTAFLLQSLLGAAIKIRENNLKGCVSISELEMPEYRLIQRMASILSQVSTLDIRKGIVGRDTAAYTAYYQALEFIEGLPIHINDNPNQTIMSASFSNNALHLKMGPVWLCGLDYLELFKDEGDSEELRVSGIARAAKALSGQIGAAVILLSQMNNEVMKTSDKIGGPARLRYSGAIWQAADVVAEIWNPIAMKKAGIDYTVPRDKGIEDDHYAWILIEKARSGEAGVFPMGWWPNSTSFKDPALLKKIGTGNRFFDCNLWYDRHTLEQDDF